MADPVFDFDEMFDEDYLYFFRPRLEESRDDAADLIWRLLALEPGSKVLDLACGHGRIANRLALRGADVSGLDASELFLGHARAEAADAGLEVNYVHGDMRSVPWQDQSFDSVISWFTSFGYFGDDENRQVLAEAYRVLRAGGRLLIELNNLVELLPRWLPYAVTERDDDFVIDRARFDPVSGRSTTERIIVRDQRVRRLHFSVRMFVAAELRDWLRAAGFSRVEFYDRQGEPLTATGARMVTVARR